MSNHATDRKHLADLRSLAAARPTGSLRRCCTRMGGANAPRRDWVSSRARWPAATAHAPNPIPI
jgi:hypothetical protein